MKPVFLLFAFLVLYSCDMNQDFDLEEYKMEIQSWKEYRLEKLKSPSGWLNLAGLYWLKEGENTFGSDSLNDLVFPDKAPQFCGSIVKNDENIYFVPDKENPITVNGKITGQIKLNPDVSGKADTLQYESLAWYIIKRDTMFGIRLRDYKHPAIDQLKEIPTFETDTLWRKIAKFIPFDEPDTMIVNTVVGIDEYYTVPGKLIFDHNGTKYELIPFKSRNGFFIILGDKTSAIETYAAGRFMYTDLPGRKNKVVLDFNKAYNPPCAFSPYATCPLPPPENRLDLRITAGEKTIHLY
jgi:hypothetical protein